MRKYSTSYWFLAKFPSKHVVDMLEFIEPVFCNRAVISDATPRQQGCN